VDFIFSFSPYERQALERVRRVLLGQTEVKFVSPEDLVIHKILAGRPRDLEDVHHILRKNRGLDIPYIQQWLAQLQEAIGEDLTGRFEETMRRSL
jgi:predicted nucleotidyltransferase